MTSIKVYFEIGHEASLKSKKTPEGFTHDWEVFVRGTEGADISHFVDKVVFYLHETFPKPRRVVKEPPFSIKESGYAGFMFPIEIYLKNKDEPKKIQFSYDFTLQQTGCLKDRYIFHNPNDEFRKKLLKGGGFPVTSNTFYTNPDQESRSRDSFTDEKHLVSKPKLSSESSKKHKVKEHKEDLPPRTSSFENVFGPPIQKPPKVSPDPKKIDKSAVSVKSDKKDKDRSSSDKKSKHEHIKESKAEKVKAKEEKERNRSTKVKTPIKEPEKFKEKPTKRPNERIPSPDVVKKRCLSPVRRPPSSPPRTSSSASNKDDYKLQRYNTELSDQRKNRIDDKQGKSEKETKEKKKKEKKSHDRDKERKEKKEHKKESQKIRESPKHISKENTPKIKESVKEKDSPPIKEKPIKQDKPINKFSIENLRKTPPPETEESIDVSKTKDKSEPERKHKHKKKDKKREEHKEKHKDSSKEKKHKHEKVKEIPVEKPEVIERKETPIPKERPLPEPTSPISIDTASQCSSKSGINKPMHIEAEDVNSSQSDSENSLTGEDGDNIKMVNYSSPHMKTAPSPELEPIKLDPSPEPEPIKIDPSPECKLESEPIIEASISQPKEKSKKHKDKSKREERRRKRKAAEDEDIENKKIPAKSESGPSYNETEWGESSGSIFMETKVQDNGVSSSLGEDAEPGDLSPNYMVQLRDLQQRIMKIKNNEELERVVNLIAETGRYEVTTQTFDFDLCLLDRSTVQQLIQMVG